METLSSVMPAELEARVHALLKTLFDRNLTVATAESCTGGLLSSVLTDIDGYGRVFERGFVTYTEAAKIEQLDVRAELLRSEGAVSRSVAIAMAVGALAHSKADIAIAITGFAGPAGPDDMPGLVHLACASRKGPVQHRKEEFASQNRGNVRIAALRSAIAMLEAAA